MGTDDFELDRAIKSHSVMLTLIGAWVWSKLSPADYLLKIQNCQTLRATKSDESAEAVAERGVRNMQVDSLRTLLKDGVGMAKQDYKRDAAKMALLRPLKTDSKRVNGTLRQAQAWISAWKKIGTTYVPIPANTFTAFTDLFEACGGEQGAVADEEAEEAMAGGDFRVAMNDLHQWSVDWYGAATRRFKANTALGMTIRAMVPTEAGGVTLGTAVLVLAYSGGLDVPGTIDCPGGTEAALQSRLEGTTTWATVQEHIELDGDGHGTFTYTLTGPGHWEFQVVPFRNGAEGVPSNTELVLAD